LKNLDASNCAGFVGSKKVKVLCLLYGIGQLNAVLCS